MSKRYPGDFTRQPPLEYRPVDGKLPDPGEVVWAWVPYEEDHGKGKTRPVLLIGYDGDWLLGVYLSSVDHDLDARQEAREGRYWAKVGQGAWDSGGRVSFARVDRVIRVNPKTISGRAERLDKARFDQVAEAIKRHWSD